MISTEAELPEAGNHQRGSCLPPSFDMYLGEIRNIPLLDEPTETALGMEVVAGRVAKERLANPDLTAEELAQCETVIITGNRASAHLAESNVRFAIKIANHVKRLGAKTPREELVAAANVGLVIASKTFDPREGRFTTHAFHQTRKEISEYLRKDETGIDIPRRLLSNISKVHKLLLQARIENRQVNIHEIAQATGYNGRDTNVLLELVSIALDLKQGEGLEEALQTDIWEQAESDEINKRTVFWAQDSLAAKGQEATAAQIAKELGFPASKENIARIRAAMESIKNHASETVMIPSLFPLIRPESLDASRSDSPDDDPLEELIPSGYLTPQEVVVGKEMLSSLREAVIELARTDLMGAQIVGLYYGLNPDIGPQTLEEIGVYLNPKMPYAPNSVGYRLKKALARLKELLPDISREPGIAA